MNKRIVSVAALVTVCCFAGLAHAKDWRGIVPLQSDRQDVEKLLGEPAPPANGSRYYTLNKT